MDRLWGRKIYGLDVPWTLAFLVLAVLFVIQARMVWKLIAIGPITP